MTLEHGGDLFAAQQVYSGEILDFSVNINPLGPAPQALEAARAALERAGEGTARLRCSCVRRCRCGPGLRC